MDWLSFVDSTYERAVWWSNFANLLLIVSLAVGVLATIIIFRASNAKEQHLKLDIAVTADDAARAGLSTAITAAELRKIKEPRALSTPQQNRIIENLKPFSGTTFVVATYPGEPEPAAFSVAIAKTLEKAGWILNPNKSKGSLLGIASGVVVVVGNNAGETAEKAGAALLETLKAEGVELVTLGHGSLQVNPIAVAIQIQVAKKP